jgi:hypothetical protein
MIEQNTSQDDAAMLASRNDQSATRWTYLGIVLAWLLIAGGLIGVLIGRLSKQFSFPYSAMVASGTLLNATLLATVKRQRT